MAGNSIEAVEKVLGQPVDGEFTESEVKLRRNLLVVGVISIFVVVGQVKLDLSSSILGFKFYGLTDGLVNTGLTVATAYLLFHFLWCAFERLLEWRLRVTGTRLAFVTGARYVSEHGDYPNDPRQSTLYMWWRSEAKRLGNQEEILKKLEEKIAPLYERLEVQIAGKPDDGRNLSSIMQTLAETRNALFEVKRAIESAEKILVAQRIPVSLKRFDQWFQLFLRSQNLRWLLIDVLAPICVGGAALILLL